MSGKIIINGKEYEGLDQVPEELRRMLKDKDGNGVPDLFEGKMSFGDIKSIMSYAFKNPGAIQIQTKSGATIGNIEELPPEAKEKMREAMQKLHMAGAESAAGMPPSQSPHQYPIAQMPRSGSSGAWTFLMIAVGLALTAAVAAWFIYTYVSAK